ncbi:retrovirus-related Pol polyprotein from transposon 412 [Trichonephila clavipes]|nr:retrovirus-related Pol polyprotein from transposon 412 [Trichonephila clavipes]
MGHVNELPCNMIIDTGVNVSIIRNDLAQKLKEKLIWTPPRVVLQTEHGFTLDFNKNELRSIHEEVTIFKIEHRTESIRRVTANENITIPPRTEIIVPGYIGNDVSFNSGLIGSAENKANGLLIASTLVDLSRKTIPVRICNVTEKPRVFQKEKLRRKTVQEFEDVFSRNSSDIGHTTVTQHRIDTADHPPIKQHPRRLPFAKQEEVGTLLREMQENDIIEPSLSPWASQSSWFVRKMAPQDFAWTIENLTTSPRRTATLFQG